jgi:hypothetical protein
MSSGLYEDLVNTGSMIPHQEVEVQPQEPDTASVILRPEPVSFISYPYEWCFSELKDAALATLDIQGRSLEFGMSLKDASAYNIQFHMGKPVLIDTLSFEGYQPGEPWVAYRQFCQHFLAPLALMALVDERLSQLLRVHIDGVPLDLASRLLPGKTRIIFGLASHIHLHAAAQKRYAGQKVNRPPGGGVSKTAMLGLLDSLRSAIASLKWNATGTEWADYYESNNYSSEAFEEKKRLVASFVERVKPGSIWDLGANTGEFSRIAGGYGAYAIAFDIDPAAVEMNYLEVKKRSETNILPLVMDLTNPSPASGWANRERNGLAQRGPADMVMALALVHHLAISNNVPLPAVSEYLATLGRTLMIEFVPKKDTQVQRLLAARKDIFAEYTREDFERSFNVDFKILSCEEVGGSERVIYLMERHQ